MAALAGEPWRGNAVVRVTNGSGTRHFRLSTWTDASAASSPGIDNDNTEWEGAPGDKVEVDPPNALQGPVTLTWDSTSPVTAPPQATVVRIQARQPGTGTIVGSTRTINVSGNEGSATVEFRFDSDPFDGDDTDPVRAGMVEWYMEVERDSGVDQWGPADTRGTFTNSGIGRSHDWAAGYARARPTLVSHSVSNVAIDGAEPTLFVYPDPIYTRVTLDAQFYSSDNTYFIWEQSDSTVVSDIQPGNGPSFNYEEDSSSELVDSDFAVGLADAVLRLDASPSFGGDKEYTWADSGHEAGWTREDYNELKFTGRIDVDPSITIINETLDNPSTTVFNRGEAQGGTFEVQNARGENFTPVGTETVTVERIADGTDEDSATVSRASGVTSWDVTFGSTGNNAPADATGDEKRLVWDDVASGLNTGKPTTGSIGFLSSLLNVSTHLQNNDNVLDPALSEIQRLTSDLGFYSIRITNQRGQGKDGVSVTDHLQDDQSLVASKDRTDTTTTVNGNAGWLPLKSWESALPGGGWDHWTDAGAFEGNTFEKTRLGANNSDYTLLSINPNLVIVTAGGHDTPGEDGLHWTAGNDLLMGCSLFDIQNNKSVPVDNSETLDPGGQPYPRAYMIVARFNNQNGAAEFLDSDYTWKSVETNPGNVYQWQLLSVRRSNELSGAGSVGDENSYVHKFTPAQTDWGLADLFFIPVVYKNSTPYAIWGITGVTGSANNHKSNDLDAVGLALSGAIGFK